ncbi:Cytochrome c551 peroxidase [Enhygromyxa salina]|uniref:Cytochrome c551 peroxidase n=1 Tax=Enhygromyxa salina TaxID=215803 RepID=A0A0C1Z5S6_9BACT|nr:methanobactin export MATE transporter MbnM [Enhygromyxa salina]KIG12964.1 Cytochrome c551 peroxidase [Enhygromyxa salina]
MGHNRWVVLVGLLALAACEAPVEPDDPEDPGYDWQLPAGVEPPPVPADNPQTAEKVELGRHLFYELRLSKNLNRACGTCHEQAKAFTDGFHRAVGTDNDLHGHNTPALANVGYRAQLGWRSPTPDILERQLLVPLLGDDPIEMGMGGNEAQLLELLAADPLYAELFAAAFPDAPTDVSLTQLAQAIAAFERTLISVDAPLDRYLRGDEDAITPAAKRGWALFRSDQVGCVRCHGGLDYASPTNAAGEVVAEAGYYNIGLYNLDEGAYPDSAQGLIELTGEASDMGRFRVPSLRNLVYTGPYMHDGSVISLEGAIDIFAAGGRVITSGPYIGDGRANPHKSPEIQPIELSPDQRSDLVALLLALSDERLVEDPALASPFK